MIRPIWIFAVVAAVIWGGGELCPCDAQGKPRPGAILIDQFVPIEEFWGIVQRTEPTLQPVLPTTEDQLPADAAKIVDGANEEITKIQQKADAEIAVIQQKADEAKRLRREKAIAALQELQDKYTREAKLDEAVAIRDRIRRLKLADVRVFRDPGSLSVLFSQIGKTFHIEVVGSATGWLWGTEVYTGDSTLAAAAVHSGVLKPGQKGIVKVTILGPQDEFEGSLQYGITSSSYGPYQFSFTVDPWRDAPAKPR